MRDSLWKRVKRESEHLTQRERERELPWTRKKKTRQKLHPLFAYSCDQTGERDKCDKREDDPKKHDVALKS